MTRGEETKSTTLKEVTNILYNANRIDVRSAALFRVALGLVTLWDLSNRWPDRCDFYSDEVSAGKLQ